MTMIPHRASPAVMPILLLLVHGLPARGAAQDVVLDEGSFEILIEGRPAGHEAFRIQRMDTGRGPAVIGNATVELADRRLEPIVQTSPTWELLQYQLKASGADEHTLMIQRTQRMRFEALLRSAEGERERELRALPGSVILTDFVASQYYFLVPHASAGARLPLIRPDESGQAYVEVVTLVEEDVEVGGRMLPARRMVLRVADRTHTVWVDGTGRVLRVEVPELGYVATRLDPPT